MINMFLQCMCDLWPVTDDITSNQSGGTHGSSSVFQRNVTVTWRRGSIENVSRTSFRLMATLSMPWERQVTVAHLNRSWHHHLCDVTTCRLDSSSSVSEALFSLQADMTDLRCFHESEQDLTQVLFRCGSKSDSCRSGVISLAKEGDLHMSSATEHQYGSLNSTMVPWIQQALEGSKAVILTMVLDWIRWRIYSTVCPSCPSWRTVGDVWTITSDN